MRVRAYLQRVSIPAQRRVVGPLATLAARGEQAHHSFVSRLEDITPGGYDAVLLPNFALESWQTLPAFLGSYVYDLSDVALLDDPRVQRAISQSQVLLVPNESAAALARAYHPQVRVQPSYLHAEYLRMTGSGGMRPTRPAVPLALLFAREASDWQPLVGALSDWLRNREIVLAVEDPGLATALADALPERSKARVQRVALDVPTYAAFLRNAFLCLFLGENPAVDSAPVLEAGYCGAPAIVGAGYARCASFTAVAASPKGWARQLALMSDEETRRRQLAATAQVAARTATVARGADGWLRTLEKAVRGRSAALATRAGQPSAGHL